MTNNAKPIGLQTNMQETEQSFESFLTPSEQPENEIEEQASEELVNEAGEEVSRVYISGRYHKRTEQLDRDGKPYSVYINDMHAVSFFSQFCRHKAVTATKIQSTDPIFTDHVADNFGD